jgi:hypothetical protein
MPGATTRLWCNPCEANLVRPQPITRIGPFSTEPPAAWLFPCAAILLPTAMLGYLGLFAAAALGASMTCPAALRIGFAFAAMLGFGAGCLAATAFLNTLMKIASIAIVGGFTAFFGSLAVSWMYAPRCAVLPSLFPAWL